MLLRRLRVAGDGLKPPLVAGGNRDRNNRFASRRLAREAQNGNPERDSFDWFRPLEPQANRQYVFF